MKISLDIDDDMTWGDIKRWVDAVESQGVVDPSTTIIATHEQYSEIQYLEVEFQTGKAPEEK